MGKTGTCHFLLINLGFCLWGHGEPIPGLIEVMLLKPAICGLCAGKRARYPAHRPQIADSDTELYISYVILIHNFNKTRDGLPVMREAKSGVISKRGRGTFVSSIGKRASGPGGALSTTHDVVTGYHIIPITRACNLFKECGCVGQWLLAF